MMKSLRRAGIVITSALTSTACTELATNIQITGSLVAGDCGEILPWEPPFATWTDTGGADAMFRIQSLPGPSSSAEDTVVFIIDQKQELKNELSTPIEVGDREFAGTRASGHITLPVRCPEIKDFPIQLFGELVFDEVAEKHGQRFVGYFEGEAVNPRTQEVVGANVRIDFDFPHRFQTPWQTYPTRRN